MNRRPTLSSHGELVRCFWVVILSSQFKFKRLPRLEKTTEKPGGSFVCSVEGHQLRDSFLLYCLSFWSVFHKLG